MNGPFEDILLTGGVVIDPSFIDAMIEKDGMCGEYRRARMCPCRPIDTRVPRADCPECHGMGWLYPMELRCETKAMAGSRETMIRFIQAGSPIAGELVATFPTVMGQPSRMDLWLPYGEMTIVDEVHAHLHRDYRPVLQQSAADDLGWSSVGPLPTVPTNPTSERLRYPDTAMADVTLVNWFLEPDGTPGRRTLVTGVKGIDYKVVDGRVVFLDGGAAPTPGTTYTVRYEAPAVYVIGVSLPVFRNVTGNKQPYRAGMTRFDRMGPGDLA